MLFNNMSVQEAHAILVPGCLYVQIDTCKMRVYVD